MPGYDLLGTFIGSEGTFGIATEATLRLAQSPPAVRTLLAEFLGSKRCEPCCFGDHRGRRDAGGARDDGRGNHSRGRGECVCGGTAT